MSGDERTRVFVRAVHLLAAFRWTLILPTKHHANLVVAAVGIFSVTRTKDRQDRPVKLYILPTHPTRWRTEPGSMRVSLELAGRWWFQRT